MNLKHFKKIVLSGFELGLTTLYWQEVQLCMQMNKKVQADDGVDSCGGVKSG